MPNIDIKMLKDGKRTVIIVTGADEERDEAVWRLLKIYYGFDDGPAPDEIQETKTSHDIPENTGPIHGLMEVKGLTPVPDENIELPDTNKMESYSNYRQRNRHVIPNGPFAGMTPLEALQRHQEEALVSLFFLAKQLPDSPERDEIIWSCRQYMSSMALKMDDYPDRESKIKCLLNLAKMGGIDAIINGYQSISDFCSNASDDEVKIAFERTMYSFVERGHKNSNKLGNYS